MTESKPKITEEIVLKMFKDTTDKCCELFAKKNHDYGNLYFASPQTNADVMSNFTRKYARLKVIYEQNKVLQTHETVEDTLKDLAVYSIMELVRLELTKNGHA
jgi:hypothetical protein